MNDNSSESNHNRRSLPNRVKWLLCKIGWHDYRIVQVTGGFGGGGSVQKRACRRCQFVSVRRGS